MIEWHKDGKCSEGCSPCDSDGHLIVNTGQAKPTVAMPIYAVWKLMKAGIMIGTFPIRMIGSLLTRQKGGTRYIEVKEGFYAIDDREG